MLSALKFVQGATARKDFVPALTHFRIKDRTVLGFNGAIAICSPLDTDLECCPQAVPFIKAIEACRDDTVEMHLTPTGRLAIRSGKFTAFVNCLTEEYPEVKPEGERFPLSPLVFDALRKLEPYIAEDASRPWARGVLFRGQSAFATNNIILVEQWVGTHIPFDMNIPAEAVREILRVGHCPTEAQVGPNSATFHFDDRSWIRCQLGTVEWPDVGRVLDIPSDPKPVPEGLFDAVESLLPFVDSTGRVLFLGDKVATHKEEGEGASHEIGTTLPEGCFHAEQLVSLQDLVEKIDFTCYPGPCPFFGDRVRGVIVGMYA